MVLSGSTRFRWFVILGSVGIFLLAFFPLYSSINGAAAGATLAVPVLALAWFYGLRGAVIASLVSIPVSIIMASLADDALTGRSILFYSIGVPTLFRVAAACLLGGLRDAHQKVKKSEAALEAANAGLEIQVATRTEELSKQREILFEGQSLAKFGTVQRDLQTGEGWWSDGVYTILGIAPQKRALTLEAFLEYVHPHDVERLKGMMTNSRKTGRRDGEFRFVRPSGEELTVHSRAKVHYDEEGNPVRLIGTMLDITERKQAQEGLRKSEERLLAAQEVAHFGSFERNLQTGAGWWSDEMYRILGLSPQECEPTFDHYLSFVHPEDLEGVKALSFRGSQKAGINRSDCRIIRPSGEIRTVYNQVRTFTDESGTPIRRLGTMLDITERKEAEMKVREAQQQLQALSRQLITAQETNWRRIARELHDDLGQDLALSSIEIEQLMKNASQSQAKRLQKLAMRNRAISTYVQTLSHQLHPSSLEHLGLVAAARSLCREVSKASGIRINFGHSKVPKLLPEDVSICLFRVLQESLTNIVKHGDVQAGRVELTGSPDKLQLNVRDSGVGFDPESVGNNGGLGLVSMRERLSLVGGELLIESQPSGGTQIRACVPLNSDASPIEHPTEVQEAEDS